MSGAELIDAIRDEMASSKNDYIGTLGELMTEFLRIHPDAEIEKGKTLKGAYEHLKAQARKKQQNGCYAMPPKEIFDGLMAAYGLEASPGDAAKCFAAAIGQTAPDHVPEPVAAADDPFDLDALLGGL